MTAVQQIIEAFETFSIFDLREWLSDNKDRLLKEEEIFAIKYAHWRDEFFAREDISFEEFTISDEEKVKRFKEEQ